MNSSNEVEKDKWTILAIDPGREKCGLAILDSTCNVLYKDIIKSGEIESHLLLLFNDYYIRKIVLGNGTFAKEISGKIKKISQISLEFIDEAYTTVEAEERYRNEHSNFWQRCFPFIRYKPAAPVDDYVAVILAERYLQEIFLDNTVRK